MMTKVIISIVIYLILDVLIIPISVKAGQVITVTCTAGSLGDYSPFQNVPTFDYGSNGLVRFHFILDGSGWSFSNNIFYGYDSNCGYAGIFSYTYDSSGFVPAGVNHLMLQATETGPGSSSYVFLAYDEDSGQPVSIGAMPPPVSNQFVSVGIIKSAGYFGYPGYREDGVRTPAAPVVNPNKKTARIPVLIVPGVMGTDIKKGEDKLWLDLGRNFTDVGDEFMDPLEFNNNLEPIDSLVKPDEIIKKKLASIFTFDYTAGLIQEFENQGYAENTDLFTFPYDWRFGVSGVVDPNTGRTTVDILQEKIQDILSRTGSDSVDVVAHSTGGLLVKKYVADHPSDHHIRKAVFVGVPNTGAPKAVKALLLGDNFDIPWLSEKEMQKIAKNMPVVYDLMPSQKYYGLKQGPVRVLSAKYSPDEGKVLDYQEVLGYLGGERGLNAAALAQAGNLHTQDFDDFDMRSFGVDVYNIVGCKAGTISQVVDYEFGDGSHGRYELASSIPGDGTVPLESATNVPVAADHRYFALKASHSKMLSQDGIRQLIVNTVSGSGLEVGKKLVTQDIGACKLNGRAVSVFSPVDVTVTDQDGNIAASDYNDVPNADYELAGEHKYIYLPFDEDQRYTIKLVGTGSGTFTMKVAIIVDNNTSETAVFSNIPVTPLLVGYLEFGTNGPVLRLDVDGDGTVDETVEASAVVDASKSTDTIPPVTSAVLKGSAVGPGSYSAGLTVELSAVDPVCNGCESRTSGVLGTVYKIDNGPFRPYDGPISVTDVGDHAIVFFSTDRAGNNEDQQRLVFSVLPAAAGSVNFVAPGPGTVGGGGSSYPAPHDVSMRINNGEPTTTAATVTLHLSAVAAKEMKISERPDFAGSEWEPYATERQLLLAGSGARTVYAQFRNQYALATAAAQASIFVRPPTDTASGLVLGVSTTLPAHGDGSLLLSGQDKTVYLVQGGVKRPFTSARKFFRLGFSFRQVMPENTADSLMLLGMPL